jgi:uracil-DNA glycosylase family 4
MTKRVALGARSSAVAFDPGCTRCPRLSRHLREMRDIHPGYHNAPVAPFGDPAARLLIVGLAPGAHGANATGRPFTGDFAGILLYQSLHAVGLATQPQSIAANDDLRLRGCRITNAVKCLPPENKPTTDEANRCNSYLAAELATLSSGSVIFALGGIAHRAVLRVFGLRLSAFVFAHGAEHALPGVITLVDSYHCSRYNTQTRRLTADMFVSVLRRATQLAFDDQRR